MSDVGLRHVYPLSEEQEHVFDFPPTCLCAPTVSEVERDHIDGSPFIGAILVSHHAFDCRPTRYPPELH